MTLVATLAREVEQTKAQQAVEKFDGDDGRTMTRLVAGQAAAGAAQGARCVFITAVPFTKLLCSRGGGGNNGGHPGARNFLSPILAAALGVAGVSLYLQSFCPR